jgi:hypothetical protein
MIPVFVQTYCSTANRRILLQRTTELYDKSNQLASDIPGCSLFVATLVYDNPAFYSVVILGYFFYNKQLYFTTTQLTFPKISLDIVPNKIFYDNLALCAKDILQ